MLILTRNRDESIIIGGCIRVTVVDVRDGKVRLGIVADGLSIDREEVHAAKLRHRADAAAMAVACGGEPGDGGGGDGAGVGAGVGGGGVAEEVTP